jgi:hypothetical protein
MSDNISFMNKVLDSFIVFIIGFVYFWLAWQIIRFYIFIFKLIFRGIVFLFNKLKNILKIRE